MMNTNESVNVYRLTYLEFVQLLRDAGTNNEKMKAKIIAEAGQETPPSVLETKIM